MPDIESFTPSKHYWIISALALLWYLFGVNQFYGSLVATLVTLLMIWFSGTKFADGNLI